MPFPVPNDPSFKGLRLYNAGVVLDPAGAFAGLAAFSNAVQVGLGQ